MAGDVNGPDEQDRNGRASEGQIDAAETQNDSEPIYSQEAACLQTVQVF